MLKPHAKEGTLDYYLEALEIEYKELISGTMFADKEWEQCALEAVVELEKLGKTPAERAYRASMNPDIFPIPEYVMNEEIWNWEPAQDDTDAWQFTFSNGTYEPLILHDSTELKPLELERKAAFAAWLIEHDHTLPESFRQNHDELRFLYTHKLDHDQAYEAMLEYEKFLDEEVVPIWGKFE